VNRKSVGTLLALIIFASPLSADVDDPCLAAIQLVPVTAGLSRPVAVRHAGDGSGRLFIVQQQGDILIYDDKQVLGVPFLDIGSRVDFEGEKGLLGLAFDPGFANNGFFYVHYNAAGTGANIISRFTVTTSDPNTADPGSEVILQTIGQPDDNHNGGDLAFGPDGYLYASVGDGGGSGDPGDNAQDLGNRLGTLLRITTDGSAPPDNPFVGDPGAMDEIWVYGLRNPFRFSFDRHTGDLFIGDVGQNDREEIDYQPSTSGGGENYGWRCYEGNSAFNLTGCGPATNYVFPIVEYSHSFGISVTGGYRYRGPGGAPFGYYLYADFGSGRIWGARQQVNGSWEECLLADTDIHPTSFGEDETGRLYLTDLLGSLHRIDGTGLFGDSFETGLEHWDRVGGVVTVPGP